MTNGLLLKYLIDWLCCVIVLITALCCCECRSLKVKIRSPRLLGRRAKVEPWRRSWARRRRRVGTRLEEAASACRRHCWRGRALKTSPSRRWPLPLRRTPPTRVWRPHSRLHSARAWIPSTLLLERKRSVFYPFTLFCPKHFMSPTSNSII